MNGVDLKDSIKLFGFRDGFPFWFKYNFIDPVQMFIWLNITHKPYCMYSGYHCTDKNCTHKHITEKRDIVAIWKKFEEENRENDGGYY